MNALATERPLVWAAAYSPDRITIAAVLGLRPLRYAGEGSPLAGPPIERLSITAVGSTERPSYHDSTGLYGFLKLPAGARRIEITDPARRVLPWAITANVPDRSTIRAALQAGVTPPSSPPPLLLDVALRPAPGVPLSPGLTAIWGAVREFEQRRAGAAGSHRLRHRGRRQRRHLRATRRRLRHRSAAGKAVLARPSAGLRFLAGADLARTEATARGRTGRREFRRHAARRSRHAEPECRHQPLRRAPGPAAQRRWHADRRSEPRPSRPRGTTEPLGHRAACPRRARVWPNICRRASMWKKPASARNRSREWRPRQLVSSGRRDSARLPTCRRWSPATRR